MLRSFSLRCPDCRGDRMPRGLYAFRGRCRACGYAFQGEAGDFRGGMVLGYTLGGLIGLGTAGALLALTAPGPGAVAYLSAAAAALAIAVLFPFAKAMGGSLLHCTRGHYAGYRAPGGPAKRE